MGITIPPVSVAAALKAYDPLSRWTDADIDRMRAALEAALPHVEVSGADRAMVAGTHPGVRSCRVCGCTDANACPGGCSWVGPDLCSACAAPQLLPELISEPIEPTDYEVRVEALKAATMAIPVRVDDGDQVLDDGAAALVVLARYLEAYLRGDS